jgi:D-lactate dehydrogenase
VIKGLDDKKISGLGLDVYEEEEEYFYEDKSNDIMENKELITLLAYPNVILTSHQAFLTHEALEQIALTTTNNIKDFLNKAFMENQVCYLCERKGSCKNRQNRINCF